MCPPRDLFAFRFSLPIAVSLPFRIPIHILFGDVNVWFDILSHFITCIFVRCEIVSTRSLAPLDCNGSIDWLTFYVRFWAKHQCNTAKVWMTMSRWAETRLIVVDNRQSFGNNNINNTDNHNSSHAQLIECRRERWIITIPCPQAGESVDRIEMEI